MSGSVINIAGTDTDTKTKIRAGAGGVYAPTDGTVANFTFLDAGATTITSGTNAGSGDPEITISSLDTITRLKGGTTGTLTSGDLTLVGGSSGNVTVSQSGSTINIDSTDNDTITRLASGSNAVNSGDFKFTATGATSITSTAFVGGLTGNVTGNVSGTAATVTGAAQSNITSVGTLTGLTLSGALTGTTASFSTASTSASVFTLTDTGVAAYEVTFPDTGTYQLGTNTTSNKTFKLLNSGSGAFNLDVEGSLTPVSYTHLTLPTNA